MKKAIFIGLMALVLVFLWNMNGYAGCLRVIAPNGGETLRQNSRYTIRWVNNCDKPVKLVLKQIRQNERWFKLIKSGIPSSQTSYDWQVGSYDGGTAAPGGGYKIVVKTMDRTSRDASDGPFTIVASSPPPQQPPRLTSFKINNGAESTSSRTVTLNHTLTGQATHYRACENSNFQGSNCNWKTYTPAPQFQLSSDFGTKTVYFQVKNSAGRSEVLSDTISLLMQSVVVSRSPFPALDPAIKAADFRVTRTYGNYSADFYFSINVSSYLFGKLPKSPYRNLKIYIEATPYMLDTALYTKVLKIIPYEAGEHTQNGIIHIGSVTYQFDNIDSIEYLTKVTLRAKIVLPDLFEDSNTNNNVLEEEFRLSGIKVLKLEHELTTCIVKDDWHFRVDLSGYWWIIKSYLMVPYFGSSENIHAQVLSRWTTVEGEHAEFDTNGALLFGSYGYRWIKHPTTEDPTGTVHAWCEDGQHWPYKVVIWYVEIY